MGITVATFAYTNHTLLPEALEKWPLDFMKALLPRHMEIIFEINRRFLDQVRAANPGDEELAGRLSIIDEKEWGFIRMPISPVQGVMRLTASLVCTQIS